MTHLLLAIVLGSALGNAGIKPDNVYFWVILACYIIRPRLK